MRADTEAEVERIWLDRLGLETAELWQDVTVRPHEGLDDDSWYVAWRAGGVHVSCPSNAAALDAAALANASPVDLEEPAFWHSFAAQRSLRVIGPATHHYLDVDPGVPENVEQVDPARLTLLRDAVCAEDWQESGLPEAIDSGAGTSTVAVAVWGTTGQAARPWVPTLRGGAVLRDLDGVPRDVGLLVADESRGRGIGLSLGRGAASYAVSWHGWASWRCRVGNTASMRTAARLGFEPYATQLAIRP